jgi:20S proteasome alpha/beta subunit
MTVCIAALYNNGNGCVLASDQMITAHFPIGYEFESPDVEKIVKINDSVCVYILVSGDVLFANEVIEHARKQITAGKIKDTAIVAEEIRKSYQQIRRNRIIRNELEPRGLDINMYYQSQQRLLAALVQVIDNAFKTYNPRVEFLVAGKDETSCHIFTIINPGDITCNDPLGYAAIGSGAPHAMYSLIESKYSKSINKENAESLIQKAKERSEVAPGVGKGTKTVCE